MQEGYPLGLLEKKINYTFKDKALLKQALTHSSFANERVINKEKDYERIEFLGDAVLELVSSEFLYITHRELKEGQLTKLRSSMVCEPALAYCAKDLGIGKFLYLGKGEESTGGRNRDSIIADVMEAIIGAMYLDSGIEAAREFIHEFILSDLEDKILFYDSKSIFQEMIQKDNLGEMKYVLAGEEGPDHDKEFMVELFVDSTLMGFGKGRTKKAAEQQAAYQAVRKLRK